MTLDEFYKLMDDMPYDDYIVRIKLKYAWEEDYHYINTLYLLDDEFQYCWNDDWNEGQECVEVLGIIAVDTVNVPYIKEADNDK